MKLLGNAPGPDAIPDWEKVFADFARELTGFDDIDPEIVSLNLALLRRNKGLIGDIDALLDRYARLAGQTASDDTDARILPLKVDETSLSLIKQVLYLFYAGALRVDGHWRRCGWRRHETALVWKALRTHPPMTRGAGEFGDWAKHPQAEDLPETGKAKHRDPAIA